MRAWTRKYNEDGSMKFSEDTLFYRDTRNPSQNTTLAQNVGENKKYYNSELGAGSVEHYIELVDKYLNKKG